MTVASATRRADYVSDGVQTVFPYAFLVLDQTHLLVTKRDLAGIETTLVLGTDYTVSGVGTATGGNVTLSAAITSGFALAITRSLPLTQNTSLRNQATFYAQTIETMMDLLTMMELQQQDQLDRSLHLPLTEAGTAAKTTLPPAAQRASQTFFFDSQGNPSVGSPTATLVSSAMQPVVQASTIAAAQGLLSVTPVNASLVPVVQAASTQAAANLLGLGLGKNVIINGNFVIDQPGDRASSNVVNAGSNQFVTDMWRVAPVGGTSATATRSTLTFGSTAKNFLTLTASGGLTSLALSQRIEGQVAQQIAGKTCVLQAIISASALTTINWSVAYANSLDTFGSTTAIASGSFTISGTDTQQATASFAVPANAVNGVVVTFTTGSMANATTVRFAEVQLAPGTQVLPFDTRPTPVEDLLCRRYYEAMPQGTNELGFNGYANAASVQFYVNLPFRVQKRGSPIFTFVGSWILSNCGTPSAVGTVNGIQVFASSVAAGMTTFAISSGGFIVDSRL